MRKFILFGLLTSMVSFGQETNKKELKEAPNFSFFRANENYEYLKNNENSKYKSDIFDPIKFIPLNKKKDIYLSFGGQFRPRYEHYSNRFWTEENEDFYSQRAAIHADLHLGRYVRFFGELYSGYTSGEERFTESDEVNFHQAFVEFTLPTKTNSKTSFIVGRQELAYGSARLVGFREGPNIRRSFDAARIKFIKGHTNIQAFYSREVRPNLGSFDNDFTLFDEDATNPKLWGLYTQFKIKNFTGLNELYYLGYNTKSATFNDVTGEETRHSIGLRRFGKLGKRFKYNTELTYQFGDIGNSNISAFNFETDWKYTLINTKYKIEPGVKLEYTSGDNEIGDGKINSFNPMFVNPAYYSLAATVTPINLISVHPSISMKPMEKLKLYFECGLFWRTSENDGLYRPTHFLNVPANENIKSKDLGSQLGFKLSYEFDRHLSFDLDLSYFLEGDFQNENGLKEDILHIAPTLSYKF